MVESRRTTTACPAPAYPGPGGSPGPVEPHRAAKSYMLDDKPKKTTRPHAGEDLYTSGGPRSGAVMRK
jgi:hypothetical protein